jgi:hypothetical protein
MANTNLKNDTFRATYPYMESRDPGADQIVVYADSSQSDEPILISGEHGFFAADDTEGAAAWLVEHGCDRDAARELVTTARAELVRVEIFPDGSRSKSLPRTPAQAS